MVYFINLSNIRKSHLKLSYVILTPAWIVVAFLDVLVIFDVSPVRCKLHLPRHDKTIVPISVFNLSFEVHLEKK